MPRRRRRQLLEMETALHDPARLAAVHSLGVIGAPPIDELDELARRAASQLRAPTSIISLLDADAQHFPGQFGLGGGPAAVARGGLPYEYSFCKFVLGAGHPLQVNDALQHPLVRDHRATTERGVRAYLGVPLRTRDGDLVGVVCAYDTFTRKWTAGDEDGLTRIAQQAMRVMEQHARTIAADEHRASTSDVA